MTKLETIKAKEVEVSRVCQRYGLAYYCKVYGWQMVQSIHTTPESALEDFNRLVSYNGNQADENYKYTHYCIFELTLENPLFIQNKL